MRAITMMLAIAGLAVASSARVDAHAYLRGAMPLVGSTVQAAPQELTLDFTEELEPRFCTVFVLNAQDQRVDKADLHIAPGNAKRLAIGLQPPPPGVYRAEWHVTSVDTHRTEGNFTFTVRP
jgi:methionine-rich copper-binding protein CopC